MSHEHRHGPTAPANPQGRRRRDAWELGIGYGLILVVLWTPPPWQRPLYFVAAAFLIAASIRPGENWRGLGLSAKNLLISSYILLLALAVAAASVLYAAHWGTLHAPGSPREFVHRFWGYILWSLAQQFLLQDFFLLRFRRLLPQSTSLAIAAAVGIFTLAHLPNPILTVFTLVWGVIACSNFVRFRNLYPLALAHAALGISVAICLPGPLTHNMRVGLGYVRFKAHGHRHLRQIDHTVSTNVCVTAEAATRRSRLQARP